MKTVQDAQTTLIQLEKKYEYSGPIASRQKKAQFTRNDKQLYDWAQDIFTQNERRNRRESFTHLMFQQHGVCP